MSTVIVYPPEWWTGEPTHPAALIASVDSAADSILADEGSDPLLSAASIEAELGETSASALSEDRPAEPAADAGVAAAASERDATSTAATATATARLPSNPPDPLPPRPKDHETPAKAAPQNNTLTSPRLP